MKLLQAWILLFPRRPGILNGVGGLDLEITGTNFKPRSYHSLIELERLVPGFWTGQLDVKAITGSSDYTILINTLSECRVASRSHNKFSDEHHVTISCRSYDTRSQDRKKTTMS